MSAHPEIAAENPGVRRGAGATFVLMCNALEEDYALTADGRGTWSHFRNVDGALAHMASIVRETTLLTVCNEHGKTFMVVNVQPLW